MHTSPLSERHACSVAEAAPFIGISRAKLYQLLDSGMIPSLKIGRRRLIRTQALRDYIDALEQSGRPSGPEAA